MGINLEYMRSMYSRTQYFIIFLLVVNCSVELQKDKEETTTTTELTYCERVEIKYVNYSNNLLDSAWQLNQYIDDISPDSMDSDREKFFIGIDINYKYKNEYIVYLENRVKYLTKIYELITSNMNCEFPNDQSITIEQVQKAQDDLNYIISK